jgi:hypothetical protein
MLIYKNVSKLGNTKRINTKRINTKRINTKRINTKRINTKRINTKRINTKRRNLKGVGYPSLMNTGSVHIVKRLEMDGLDLATRRNGAVRYPPAR